MTDGIRRSLHAIEWPTVLLACLIYGGWGALTWFHDRLPLWALIAPGAWLIAWHGSLQHETIHGHPSRSRRLNGLIGAVPLSLWLPYACYRREHLVHHRAEIVTHPVMDPESRYLPSAKGLWARLRIAAARTQAPLLGRLLLGPPVVILGFWAGEAIRLWRAPAAVAREWLPHLLGCLLVVGWLAACQLDLALYALLFVYPGTSLSLLRSFAEHRAAPDPEHRVAVVEKAGLLALLYLNNNLHAAHHRAPAVAWFRLPGLYRRNRAEILRRNGGLVYQGYGEIVRRYALQPQDALIHPYLR